jgi:hypothetical protein
MKPSDVDLISTFPYAIENRGGQSVTKVELQHQQASSNITYKTSWQLIKGKNIIIAKFIKAVFI